MPGDTRLGHGEVFDIDGRVAKQTDIVVANQYHAALHADWEEPQKFTIESVQCGAEVKSSLTDLLSLRDCFEKAKAFKSLLMAPENTMFLMSMGDDERRFLLRRPYFVFAFESRLTLSTMFNALTDWELGTASSGTTGSRRLVRPEQGHFTARWDREREARRQKG